MAMSTGPITCTMIIGHAVGKSAAPIPGNIPGAKKSFARARRTRRSTTGAAARPAAPLRSSTIASSVRSRSSWANDVSFMPRPRFRSFALEYLSKRALTMTLPFWLGRSKILSIDHNDSGADHGARGEAWNGATERVRRDDGAGGSDELLLGARVRADLGT